MPTRLIFDLLFKQRLGRNSPRPRLPDQEFVQGALRYMPQSISAAEGFWDFRRQGMSDASETSDGWNGLAQLPRR